MFSEKINNPKKAGIENKIPNFILILCIIFGIIIYSALMYFLGTKELEINKWKIQKK